MRREQKTATAGCRYEGKLETESNSVVLLVNAAKDGAENLLEKTTMVF